AAPTRPAYGNQPINLKTYLRDHCLAASWKELINHPAGNGRIAVNPPVAQKRPVAADFFQSFQVHFTYKNFFFTVRGVSDDPPERIGQERSAPELESIPGRAVSANVPDLKPNAVYYPHINSVGNRMRPLNGPPRVMLCHAEFFFLHWVPPDCCGIKQKHRA